MSEKKTSILNQLVKEQARARVRHGDPYADIARDLNISLSTLGNWAAEGRWRKKDIAFEQDEERGKALLARIAETRAREQEEAEKRAAKARELGEAAMKAMRAADPKGDGTPPGMAATPTHELSLAMAHALLEQGNLGEAERAARFAMRFAQAQNVMNDHDAERWREDRREILDWWKKNRDGFISFHRYANETIDELKSMVKYERLAREAGACPTCARPADFWPAEMSEAQDTFRERIEELELAEDEAKAADEGR